MMGSNSGRGAVRYPQTYEIGEGETRAPKCSFLGDLPSGVLLTGSPTVTEIGSADLTLANAEVNTIAITIGNNAHAAGQAVTFTIAGAKAGRRYLVAVSCGTDGSPAETIRRTLAVRGVRAAAV